MERHDRIGRRLKLRDLHTFVTVVQRGSMAKAAAALGLTQPAISKTIADMEGTLGVRLLDRKPQGVEPTLFGQTLLKGGGSVFEELRHTVREIESLADPAGGEVWIGATHPMVEGLLPAAIDPLSRENPRIVFHVTVAPNTAYQYDELRSRKLDLIIGRMPAESARDDLSTEILFDEPQFVVAGVNNRWVGRRRLKLADLIDEPWVLPRPEYVGGSVVAKTFQASGLQLPRHGAICSSLQFTYALIATGRYLGLFPRSLLHFGASRYALKVLPVKLPITPPPVGIVTLKNRTIHPAAKLLIESVRSTARSLARRAI